MNQIVLYILLFCVIMIVLYAWAKVTRRPFPGWIAKIYVLGVLFCWLTWESWMSFGWVDGDSSQERGAKSSSNLRNSWEMALGDGWLCVAQVGIAYLLYGKEGFTKWNWKVFSVMFAFGFLQNVVATIMLRKQLKSKDIAWAPLMPVKANSYIQVQEAWIIQPFVFYGILIGMNKLIF